jgi:hypothetical protein
LGLRQPYSALPVAQKSSLIFCVQGKWAP